MIVSGLNFKGPNLILSTLCVCGEDLWEYSCKSLCTQEAGNKNPLSSLPLLQNRCARMSIERQWAKHEHLVLLPPQNLLKWQEWDFSKTHEAVQMDRRGNDSHTTWEASKQDRGWQSRERSLSWRWGQLSGNLIHGLQLSNWQPQGPQEESGRQKNIRVGWMSAWEAARYSR